MASISREPNGRRTIQFVGPDGKRRSIRLGKVSQRTAEGIKVRVESLVTAAITGNMDDDLARWVAEREDAMIAKLAAVGLVPKRAIATLEAFLNRYIESRVDVKPATITNWTQVKRSLIDHFGADRPLRSITVGDCENYRLYLLGRGFAPTTAARWLRFARQFFTAARKHKLVAVNPFSEIEAPAASPSDRQFFVTAEATRRLLEAAPGIHWKVIIGLSRWGGMRCPSEVLSLRWQDVDWEKGRLTVTSPKTEHRPGRATRVVPLFPELRPILEAAFEAAPEGAVYVVDPKYRKAALGPRGWMNCNLRTTFEKIIKRAGLTPWPRLFHNLRASRETELADRFPIQTVTAWMGNTPRIAMKHYLQVRDEDFDAAVNPVQNPVQQAHAGPRNAKQPKPENPVSSGVREGVRACAIQEVDRGGVEPPTRGFSVRCSTS